MQVFSNRLERKELVHRDVSDIVDLETLSVRCQFIGCRAKHRQRIAAPSHSIF